MALPDWPHSSPLILISLLGGACCWEAETEQIARDPGCCSVDGAKAATQEGDGRLLQLELP